MAELIAGIEAYAGWLLALLAALAVRELVLLSRALRDRAQAAYGLEREEATGRATRALVQLLLLATVAFGVNMVASVVAPGLPDDVLRRGDDGALIAPTRLAPLPSATPNPPTAAPTERRRVIIVTAPPHP